ncbi:MAG: hypothetical protein WBD28_07145 [Candidatus Zixiibacteriota bacterium]
MKKQSSDHATYDNDLLTWNGLYQYHANVILLKFTRTSYDKQLQSIHSRSVDATRPDWKQVNRVLTMEHECCHFTDFLVSPFLSFIEYLNEAYVSNFYYFTTSWLTERGGRLNQPISHYANQNDIPSSCSNLYNFLCGLTSLRRLMLFEPATVGRLVSLFNAVLRPMAVGQGLERDNVIRVCSRRKPDHVIGSSFTTLNILEGLARCSEHTYLQDNLHASPQGLLDWYRHKMFGPYSPALEYVFAKTNNWRFATQLLSLCLRARFFPYLHVGEVFLEDFHPVLLLEQMIDDLPKETIDQIARGSDSAHMTQANSILTQLNILADSYNLVDSAELFWSHWEFFNRKLSDRFPNVSKSDSYRHKVHERRVLQDWREAWYNQVNGDPLSRPIKSPAYLVFVDGLRGHHSVLRNDNDAYARPGNEGYLHRVSLATMKIAGLADFVLFGDRETWRQAQHVVHAVHTGSSGRVQKMDDQLEQLGYKLAY